MDRYNWADVKEERMSPLVSRRVVHTVNSTLARIDLRKGAIVPEHTHVNEQVTNVERGVLEFRMSGETFKLRAGEFLVIPANIPHQVEALEDSIAVDLFTPPREDWIRGDDAYLRR